MKAVLARVPGEELERRKRLGLDRYDEMWQGVLHKSPAPSEEHQRILMELGAFLLSLIKKRKAGTLRPGVNVFSQSSPKEDYRIPDLAYVAAGNEAMLHSDGVHGGPDAVIEIRSPDDETYEKLPFFAALRVQEVIVIDAVTKRTEIFKLMRSRYVEATVDAEGWLTSLVLGVRFRTGRKAKLHVEAKSGEALEL